MIEPPGDFGRRRVFEIDNRVLVAREIGFVKQRAGAMQKAGELEVNIAPDSFAVEAGKQRS